MTKPKFTGKQIELRNGGSVAYGSIKICGRKLPGKCFAFIDAKGQLTTVRLSNDAIEAMRTLLT